MVVLLGDSVTLEIAIIVIVLGCIVEAVVVEIIIEITTASEVQYQVAGAKAYLQASECQLMETHPARCWRLQHHNCQCYEMGQ